MPIVVRPSLAIALMVINCGAIVAPDAALPASSKAGSSSAARPGVPATTASAFGPANFAVERHTLKNGLTVITHEDHSVPAVAFWQWYKVGSRNEAPGITGISHYFEHMMFNGSKNVPPKEYDRILESNGGYSNAFTDRDMTAYYEEIASDRLETVYQLDADRMAALSLLPEQLKSEMSVVKEERRLSTDNDIDGMLDEQLYATAFNASTYRWPVLGWVRDLDRISREDCVNYFRTYYAPNNCILLVVGDFDTQKALADIEKWFGPIPAQAPPAALANAEPAQRGERRVDVHYPAETVTVDIGYKAPNVASDDLYTIQLLATLLSDGESSRLHQALVVDRQLALEASSFFRPHLDPTLFEVYLEMRPGKTADQGLGALDSVLARLQREGPTERELEKAKNIREASFVKGLKTNYGIGEQLGFHEQVFGDYRAMFRTVERTRAVTADDCRRVSRTLFDPLQRTVAILVPEPERAQGGR